MGLTRIAPLISRIIFRVPSIVASMTNPVNITLFVIKRILIRAVMPCLLKPRTATDNWKLSPTSISKPSPFARCCSIQREKRSSSFTSCRLLIFKSGVPFVCFDSSILRYGLFINYRISATAARSFITLIMKPRAATNTCH